MATSGFSKIPDELVAVFHGARLEAEVAPKRRAGFETRYAFLTDSRPEPDGAYQIQANKFGVEARVYFNATEDDIKNLRRAGFNVTFTAGYRNEYAYRINSVDLFWDLIRKGFKLGDN